MVGVVTVDEVKKKMGLPLDVLENDEAIESAIQTATLHLYSVLETRFDEVSGVEDVFFLRKGYSPPAPDETVKLRLSRGFVKAGLVLTHGTTRTSITETLTEDTDYFLDTTKGLIRVSTEYYGKYFKAVYDAGFGTGDTVPEWIRDAILVHVPVLLNATQTTNRNDEYKDTMKMAHENVGVIVSPYLRGRAFQHWPL